MLTDAGDPGHHVIQAFEMLDIERRPHADARIQELLDVLPALGVAGNRVPFGQVGVRELVD